MSDEIEEYKVRDGIIVSPGKFEGEPYWMPTLYDMVLGGMADESIHDGSTAYDAFKIDSNLSILTGLKVQDAYLVIWSDDNGFINHMIMNQNELDNLEPVTLDDEPDLIDSDFDGVTQEWYGSCLPVGFVDSPETGY
jgi:hypothetical protein